MDDYQPSKSVSPRLACMFFVITIGTSFQFGYHTGVINQPLQLISHFIGNVTYDRTGSTDDSYVTTLTSLCVTGFLIGGLVGGLMGGFLGNKFGRRRSILALSAPCLTGCALLMASQSAGSFEMIIIGRLLVGLACGAYTAIGPAYLSEVAPPAIRGAAGVLNQLVTVIALVLSQLLGLPQVMNSERLWPFLLGLNAIPCVISVVCLFFAPESPRYLYLVKNNEQAAREALVKLERSELDVKVELDEMSREAQTVTRKISLLDIWRIRHLRWGLLVAIVPQIGQQLSGINGLLYYSVELFKANGLNPEQSTYATIGIGGVLFVITLVSVFIIDRVGRRVLLIGGLLVAFFSLAVFTGCLIIRHTLGVHWPVYLAITAIYIFICGFAVGPGSIPWFIVAEMFTQETRDAAISMAVLVNWLCNILVGLVFLQMIKHIGIYSFLPFIVVLFCVILFLFFYLPETKGQSATSIEAQFLRRVQGRSSRDQDSGVGDFSTSATAVDRSYSVGRNVPSDSNPYEASGSA